MALVISQLIVRQQLYLKNLLYISAAAPALWNIISPRLGWPSLTGVLLKGSEDLSLPSGLGMRQWCGAHKMDVPFLNYCAFSGIVLYVINCLIVFNACIACMAVLFLFWGYCLCFNYKLLRVINMRWVA